MSGSGNKRDHEPVVAASEDTRGEDTQEWDVLIAEVQQGVIDDLNAEREQQTTGTRIDDGPNFPAFRVGPQASRDPRFVGPDWRLAAPAESRARQEAKEHPVTPYDEDVQEILKAVFALGQPDGVPER